MVLFVSDMHFGARDREVDRRDEDALLRCLRAQADASDEPVEHLYLVGDVFDTYVEYRHLVPKGCVRLQAMLAEWVDRGTAVTYLIGNHDPWHDDYFETELGVRVAETVVAQHGGVRVHLEHGDAVGSTHGLYPSLRPWLRHAVPVWLYRTLMPGDAGIGLARWVSETVREHETDPDLVAALETHARRLLTRPASSADSRPVPDLVVMGHSHVPVLTPVTANGTASGSDADGSSAGAPAKAYLNTGNWFDARTFGRLDTEGGRPEIHLMRWNGQRAVGIEATSIQAG